MVLSVSKVALCVFILFERGIVERADKFEHLNLNISSENQKNQLPLQQSIQFSRNL